MNTNSRFSLLGPNTLSTWMLVLLFIQIILSALIIRRLNSLDASVNNLTSTSQVNAQVRNTELPSYIEDVSIDDDPWKGTQNAPITIIEFADYQCPYCASITPVIDKILQEYDGEILYVYRDFPLQHIHPHAFHAAEAANCAGDQGKYWEMHDLLYANQETLDPENFKQYALELELDQSSFDECLDLGQHEDEITHDIEQAAEYQVSSTPTFFINGHRVVGPTGDTLSNIIEGIVVEDAG